MAVEKAVHSKISQFDSALLVYKVVQTNVELKFSSSFENYRQRIYINL
jgi:hypothetical protein